jgi:ketosteroid isomerase-like protein
MTVADNIIALEKSALDRWCAGDPDAFLDLSAEEVTYFDPFRENRLDGHAALTQLYDSLRGQIDAPRHEMIEPKVQVVGDAAVLTFRFVSWNGSEGARVAWNCSEVYRHGAEGWRIIHTHWSFTGAGLTAKQAGD